MGRGKPRWNEDPPVDPRANVPAPMDPTIAVPLEAARGELDRSVAELYRVLRSRGLSEGGPDICTPHCAPIEVSERIAAAGRPSHVRYDDLYEFLCAAKGDGAGEDIAFLFPRIAERLAEGRDPKGMGLFAILNHYFPPVWPTLEREERGAVRSFLGALTRWRLCVPMPDLKACPFGSYPSDPDFGPPSPFAPEFAVLEIIEMTANGGIELNPVRDALLDPPPSLVAADVLADLVLDNPTAWRKGSMTVEERYRAEITATLRTVIAAPSTIRLLERRALSDGNGELAERASLAHQIIENEAPVRVPPRSCRMSYRA